jgi:hypothetical protein
MPARLPRAVADLVLVRSSGMKLRDRFTAIATGPFAWSSHPRVSPNTLSFLGAAVALFVFCSGLYLTVIVAHEGRGILRGIGALLMLPFTVLAIWLVGIVDYHIRVLWHRCLHPSGTRKT